MQDVGGVAAGTATRIVLRIGQDNRTVTVDSQRVGDRRLRPIQSAAERGALRHHRVGEALRDRLGRDRVGTVSEHTRSAIIRIGQREARRDRGADAAGLPSHLLLFLLLFRDQAHQARTRFDQRAL